jgi:hypothetical protein
LLIPLLSFKELVKRQFPQLKNANGTFPKANQSSLYKALFEESFNAHDSLEDVLALRKILFSSKLELSTRTIVDHSQLVTTNHAVEDMKYFYCCYRNMQMFNCFSKKFTEANLQNGKEVEDTLLPW